jgi:hypothetical protein
MRRWRFLDQGAPLSCQMVAGTLDDAPALLDPQDMEKSMPHYEITLADAATYDAALALISAQDDAALRRESSSDRQLSLVDPSEATVQALRALGATVDQEFQYDLEAQAATI